MPSLAVPEGYVAWVGDASTTRARGGADRRGPGAQRGLWDKRTAVLTSATVPLRLPERVGPQPTAPTCSTSAARSTTASTPCSTAPPTCPTRATPAFAGQSHDELEALIAAAGGRTLALFTSWRAMRGGGRPCVRSCRTPCSPRTTCRSRRCIAAFAAEETSCLFATAGLFQGIDVPGPTLSAW